MNHAYSHIDIADMWSTINQTKILSMRKKSIISYWMGFRFIIVLTQCGSKWNENKTNAWAHWHTLQLQLSHNRAFEINKRVNKQKEIVSEFLWSQTRRNFLWNLLPRKRSSGEFWDYIRALDKQIGQKLIFQKEFVYVPMQSSHLYDDKSSRLHLILV